MPFSAYKGPTYKPSPLPTRLVPRGVPFCHISPGRQAEGMHCFLFFLPNEPFRKASSTCKAMGLPNGVLFVICTKAFLNLGLRTPKLAITVDCSLPCFSFILERLEKTC